MILEVKYMIQDSGVFKKIEETGIIPVIKIDDPKSAVPLGKALLDGGLPIAEVTFRTEAAEEAIGVISKEYPQLLVGAGTVLTEAQVDRAVIAGAKFIVSPGLNTEVVKYCIDRDIPIVPGCCTPSDIEKALSFGLKVVKFFPAEASGGLNMLKAISAPYSMVKFIPTGGIHPGNLNDYLAFNRVLACGGSWMVKDELIKQGSFDEITRLCSETIKTVMGFELAHIGVNSEGEAEALDIAKCFSKMFIFGLKEGISSHFSGTGIEIIKGKGLGGNGHIAVRTNSINRALAYLHRCGQEPDMKTAKYDSSGNMTIVYLKAETGGFALHLLQKISRLFND